MQVSTLWSIGTWIAVSVLDILLPSCSLRNWSYIQYQISSIPPLARSMDRVFNNCISLSQAPATCLHHKCQNWTEMFAQVKTCDGARYICVDIRCLAYHGGIGLIQMRTACTWPETPAQVSRHLVTKIMTEDAATGAGAATLHRQWSQAAITARWIHGSISPMVQPPSILPGGE